MFFIIDNQSLGCWGIGKTEDEAWEDMPKSDSERVSHRSSKFKTSGCCPTVLACVSDDDLDEVVGKKVAEEYRSYVRA